MRTNRTILEDRVTIAFAALVVFGLGLLSAARWSISPKVISVQEKRHLEAFPHLRMNWDSLLAFPSKFEIFTNDRFAFRTPLIGALSKAKYKVLGISQNPNVLVGKDGWLFYLGEGEGYAVRHDRPFTDAEVEAWAKHFEARRAWLARRNIDYLVYIAPAKSEIYPAFVPSEYSPLSAQSRQDQLLDALKRLTKVHCLDLRGSLLAAKARFVWPLYFRTDTHWNTLGAFVAYQPVAEYLAGSFPKIVPAKLSDMSLSEIYHDNGDLACLMGLNGQIPEHVVRIRNKQFRHWTRAQEPELTPALLKSQFAPPLATEVNDATLPRAVFIRDSFMDSQQPFFSEHFRRACYYWSTSFPLALIEKEKPDIVVEEFVERNLFSKMASNPREVESLPTVELVVSKTRKMQLGAAAQVEAE